MNGSGKSTLLKIIYGVINCEKSVRINGQSYPCQFERPDLLSMLPQSNFLPGELSVLQALNHFRIPPESKEINDLFEAKINLKTKIGKLSSGEKRMLELFVILGKRSKFTILDEPFTHLSPLQIESAIRLLQKHQLNMGILLTDHFNKQVDEINEKVVLLKNGITRNWSTFLYKTY